MPTEEATFILDGETTAQLWHSVLMTQEIIIEPEKLDCDAIAKQLTSYSVTCTPRDVEKQLTKLIKSGEITRFGVITHAEDTEEDAAPAMKSVRREPADAAPNPSLKRSANGKEKGDGTEAVTIKNESEDGAFGDDEAEFPKTKIRKLNAAAEKKSKSSTPDQKISTVSKFIEESEHCLKYDPCTCPACIAIGARRLSNWRF